MDRAGAGAEGHDTPPPRDSATLILLRAADADQGAFEVCLLRRPRSMAFAPGQYVFPGGAVEPGDQGDAGAGWAGPQPRPWAERTPTATAEITTLVRAAVRETFEEVGVLFAGPRGDTVVCDLGGQDWEADRRAVAGGELDLGELLRRRSLILRRDLIHPFGRWVTPPVGGRRFDTRFFVARLPEGQCARAADGETEQLEWMSPAAAVEGWRRGDLAMMPPTVETLRRLSGYTDLDAVFADTASMDPMEPQVRTTDGRRVIVTPTGTEYPLPPLRGRN